MIIPFSFAADASLDDFSSMPYEDDLSLDNSDGNVMENGVMIKDSAETDSNMDEDESEDTLSDVIDGGEDKSIPDEKSLSSGVGDEDGINVDSDAVTMAEGKSAYINGTLYFSDIYAGTVFTYSPIELIYSYTGDDSQVHTGTFETDDDSRFSLDLSQLPNLSKDSSPYHITLSCEDEMYAWLNDDVYPESTTVTVTVVEGGDDPGPEPIVYPIMYVSNRGNDDTGQGTYEYPFATIEKAVSVINETNENYELKVEEGYYQFYSIISNNRNLTITGLGDVIFDLNNENYGFDIRYVFSISNIKFINAYGTNYGASVLKSTTSWGESVIVNNCTFINCTGYAGGAITTWYGGYAFLKVTNSTFINCSASYSNGGAIAVSYSQKAEISDCTFINNTANVYGGALYFANSEGGSKVNNCIFINNEAVNNYDDIYSTGSLNADNNYWSTNARPTSDSVNNNVLINNWVVLDYEADLSKVAVGDDVDFTFVLKDTDGENVYSLNHTIPELSFSLATDLGEFNDSDLTTVNGIAGSKYTAIESGSETVSLNLPSNALNITFDVIGDESNVIYVASNGSDTSGTGSESNPFKTIGKALTKVSATRNTIYVKKGTYIENDLIIDKDLTIIGEDVENTIVDANQNGRIFVISGDIDVEIKTITLTNGKVNYAEDDINYAGKGGAILLDSGNLKLNNTIISNSKSASGAVASIAGASGSIYIIDSSFVNNSLDDDAYDIGYFDISGGAAIYTDSNLFAYNSNFTNNSANALEGYNDGGAIHIVTAAIIDNCVFENNKADNGGAIYVGAYANSEVNITMNTFKSNGGINGAAIYGQGSKLTNVLNNRFEDNNASSNGGAFYLTSLNNVFNVSTNDFLSNHAKNGAVAYIRYAGVSWNDNLMANNDASVMGDALFVDNAKINANLEFLSNTTLTVGANEDIILIAKLTDDMNNPISNGNISFCLDDEFVGNALTDNDGIAKLSYHTNETLAKYLVSGNFSGSSDSYPSSIKTGLLEVSKYYWFIGTQGYFTLQDAVDASLEGDVITGLPGTYAYEEVAIGDRINKIYKNVTIKADNLGDIILTGIGGRIFDVANKHAYDDTHRPSSLTLINIIIENCSDNYGGAIYNDAYLTCENCIFRNNTATNPDEGSKWHGGAIMSWGVLNINNCTFIDNKATSGAAINTESIHGDASVIIRNSIFENNNVSDVGGALYIADSNGHITIVDNCTFINNSAASGGAVFDYANLTLNNSVFINNTAEEAGGAIYLYHNSLRLNNATVEGSTAQWGGALFMLPSITRYYVEDDIIVIVDIYNITNSRFDNNNASLDGGVIYAGHNTVSTGFIYNSNFTNNHALRDGGVIFNDISDCTINQSRFINNTGNDGGVLFNYGIMDEDAYSTIYPSYYFVYDSYFENNKANANGGSIYNDNEYSYVNLRNSIFNGSEAVEIGGVIFNNGFMDLSDNAMSDAIAGNANYIYNNFSIRTSYLTVLDNETIEFNLNESSYIILNVTVTDDMGNNITGKTVVFNINGATASQEVEVNEGLASYRYKITSVGEYDVSAIYSGCSDSEFIVKTAHISAYMPNYSALILNQTDYYVGDDFIIKLVDENNQGISNKTVNVTVVSTNPTVVMELVTNANGEVCLSNLSGGVYQIFAKFNGDKEYLPSNCSYVLSVNKFNTSILVNSIGNQFIAKLINSTKNAKDPLSNKELIIRLIDGKGQITVRNDTTDSFGNVYINELEIGNYLVFVQFAGDDSFINSSISKEIYVNDTGVIAVEHTGDDRKDIQTAIDKANPGDIIYLGDYNYENVSDVNITKDLTILGGSATTISSASDGKAIFNIPPISDNGPSEVNISSIEFKLNNGDVVVLATSDNSSNPLSIETAAININDNIFTCLDGVVGESVTVLKLESERGVLAPSNEISVSGNTMDAGINPFEFDVTGVINNNDVDIPSGPISPERTETQIVYENMTTTAVDVDTDGRVGEYFYITLKDKNGNLLKNKPIQIGFNGVVYDRTTDGNGSARLQINLKNAGTYTFAVSYLGDNEYNGSFIVAKIVVSKQKGSLTVPNKSYKASATSKTLTATFKSASGKVVKDKKITFTVNGKSYSATTNAKGVATVKVSLNAKGTYSFTAKFAGNNMYAAISKTAKLTIK